MFLFNLFSVFGTDYRNGFADGFTLGLAGFSAWLILKLYATYALHIDSIFDRISKINRAIIDAAIKGDREKIIDAIIELEHMKQDLTLIPADFSTGVYIIKCDISNSTRDEDFMACCNYAADLTCFVAGYHNRCPFFYFVKNIKAAIKLTFGRK